MNCNLKDCYWNLWNSNGPFNDELSKQCVSEDLKEHYDETDKFQLKPNNKECPGYRPYIEFCGVHKGE